MKLGLKHIGLSLGVLSLVATAGYVGSNYVDGNYVQGTYTSSGGRPVDAAPPPDAATTTMSVAIADSADPVITGADAYSYTITLTNTGAIDATTVSVATTLDASLTYVSSSGTGWSCSRSLQVVTCTRATAAPGAQPGITINVTTGSSAVSASSSVLATAANASNATASQGTTVQLVSKDALAGIYLPASSTEWTNFIARKGLTISVPDAIWLMQEGSGDAADSSGNGFTLTASGTGLAYQQSVAGWSRKAITFTDGSSASLKSTSASLPDISTTSQLTLLVAAVSTPGNVRRIIGHGTTRSELRAVTTPAFRVMSGANQADGVVSPGGVVRPLDLRTNRTTPSTVGFTDGEKITPTFSTSITGKTVCFGANGDSNAPPMSALYGLEWHGAHAEITDAALKATEQAMGFAITW